MIITQSEIIRYFRSRADEKYRAFNEKIVHTSGFEIIGVRMPDIKAYAKQLSADYKEIFELPYNSFEEIMLKGAATAFAKASLSEKEPYILRYAQMIDNWAECDCFCTALKVKANEKEQLMQIIDKLIFSPSEFISRTGIVLMFSALRDENSVDYAFSAFERLPCGQYYRDMAVAWALSVYCVYYPEKTADYLKKSKISTDIKCKTAQKIRDSRRIDTSVKNRITDIVNSQRQKDILI